MHDGSQRGPADGGRRALLKALALAPAAALPAVAAAPAQAMRARPDQRAQRYRETDHVRKFYETNKR